MKIKYTLPQTGVEGELVAYDRNGKKVDVARVEWKPFFYRPEACPVVMYASVQDAEEETTQRVVLCVSGRNARLSLSDRTRAVQPSFERNKHKEPTQEKRKQTPTQPSAEPPRQTAAKESRESELEPQLPHSGAAPAEPIRRQ